ncbi:MAG TPA: septal ring lytic transglycosylase RlpA family protein [Thermoanaerobaculia bacterium]|nr:septal ring lytic transglycosylase RlpA family protein [Thermoanaerobaculia bacterium]
MTARPRPFLSLALFAFHLLSPLLVAGCSGSRSARLASEEIRPASGATQRGLASWYGTEFANLPTASGEIFRPEKVSAAHRTLPLGTVVDVVNEKNGRTVRVRINDRGPFVAGRVVDLSRAAAEEIGSVVDGVVPVTLTVVSLGDVPTEALAKTMAAEIAPGGFSVQAGAFGNEENAKRLRDRLADRFPNPYLETYQGLLRVKFGPYPTREAAEAARDSLSEFGLAGIVVPYR